MIPSIIAAAADSEVVTSSSGNYLITLFGGLVMIVLVGWFFASDRDKTRRNVGTVVMIATVIFSILAIAPVGGWMSWISGEKKFSEVSKG